MRPGGSRAGDLDAVVCRTGWTEGPSAAAAAVTETDDDDARPPLHLFGLVPLMQVNALVM